MRTRDGAGGGGSGVGDGGGAVALMAELLSGYPTLPENSPVSSYRYGNKVRVWSYTEALAALRQVGGSERMGRSKRSWPPINAYRCSHYAGGRRGSIAEGHLEGR